MEGTARNRAHERQFTRAEVSEQTKIARSGQGEKTLGVLVRLDHVARRVENANQSILPRATVDLRRLRSVFPCACAIARDWRRAY
jgi:hypothetical protein